METSQSTNLEAKRKHNSVAISPKKAGRNDITRKGCTGMKETEVSDIRVDGTFQNFTLENFEHDSQKLVTYNFINTFVVPPPVEERPISSENETTFWSYFVPKCWSSAGSISGSVPKSMSHNSKEGGGNDGEFFSRVHRVPSSSNKPAMNTLEDSLNFFELKEYLCSLEDSLEEVRRNKISKEDHTKYFNSFDKVMQKKSIVYHPDRVRQKGGSKCDEEGAQKIQAVLNTTRKVLNVLTEEFLKYIDIDYKYEYFLKLDISILANDTELSRHISEMLFKISELSEIKRMNIVGEIRKFLLEVKECIDSYNEGNKKEFKTKCSYALYHLKKCIEGYEKFEIECQIIEKECGEDEENMKSTIRKLAKQSSEELIFLKKLESISKRSLNGKFHIFPLNEALDAYFILPFVYYVNVMLMCNIMLEKEKRFRWSSCTDETIIPLEPSIFADACYLASYYNGQKQFIKEVAHIMQRKYFDISKEDIKEKFNNILRYIVKDLDERFRIDTYNEGKTNRMLLNEKLSNVNERMANLEKKEKELIEQIRMYEEDTAENWKKYHQIEQRNEDMERKARENLGRIKNDIDKLFTNSAGNLKVPENEDQEKWRKEDHAEKQRFEREFQEYADQNESIRENIAELMLQFKPKTKEKRNTFEYNTRENRSNSDDVKYNHPETKYKPSKSYEQVEIMGENLSELRLRRNMTENVLEVKNDQIMKDKIIELEKKVSKNFNVYQETLEELSVLRSKLNKSDDV